MYAYLLSGAQLSAALLADIKAICCVMFSPFIVTVAVVAQIYGQKTLRCDQSLWQEWAFGNLKQVGYTYCTVIVVMVNTQYFISFT